MSTSDAQAQSTSGEEINRLLSPTEEFLKGSLPYGVQVFVNERCYHTHPRTGEKILKKRYEIPSISDLDEDIYAFFGVAKNSVRPVIREWVLQLITEHYDYITGTTR